MNINPGKFNKKIEMVEYIIAKDNDGFSEREENIILKTWAQVTNISGTELIRNNSDFSEVKTRFLMRTPKIELDKDIEIKFKGNYYGITYINDYSYDKKYTEIIAEKVVK